MVGLTWTMPCDHGMTVRSAQLRHRLACWGYVFQEAGKPPTEKEDVIKALGLQPGEALAQLSAGTKPSDLVRCQSRKPVLFRDVLNPPIPGRKVVLLGDTCDSTAMEGSRYILLLAVLVDRAWLLCLQALQLYLQAAQHFVLCPELLKHRKQ